jgi:tripartite-type tricarboxylate transporter receptor subunit TctC
MTTMRMTRRGLMLGGAAAATMAATGGRAFASGWTPNKPIEMVIMGGQGGGADRLARLFQTIIQKNDLSPMPIIPVNKGGGSGAEALRYLKDKAGDPNVIMATLNSYYTTPLRSDIGVDIAEFTPIARMALDTFALWVNPERHGFASVDEFVEAVRAAGGAWKMGGTGTGQEDSLITAMLEQTFDIKFTYVPFDGGGDVAKALVGGHIDSTVNNPSEALPFVKAGKATALGAFTAERIPAMPETPTMRELGHDLVYEMQRSFVAPGGLTAEQVAFYEDMMRRLSETAEWQEYAQKNALVTDLLQGAALQEYFLAEREKHAELLASLAS